MTCDKWRTYVSVTLTITGSDNGLSPVRRQAIICTSAGILLTEQLETSFSEIWITIQWFSFQEMSSTYMAAILSRPQCVKRASPHGGWFSIKMKSYQYGKSHCGGKRILESSYLQNEISYTGKTQSWYWITALVVMLELLKFIFRSDIICLQRIIF